jgi:1-deoxy-D-xylulose-5-phosphate synthase
MLVSAPMNEQEMRNLLFTAVSDDVQQPMSIRYPRGNGVMLDWKTPFEKIKIGKGRTLVEGAEIAFLTIGAIGNLTTKAVHSLAEKGINAGHYDMRFVKPLDEELLHHICQKYPYLITVEDGCIQGGFGSAVLEFMADHGYTNRIIRLGIPDKVVHQGTQAELYAECGYDTEAMIRTAMQLIGQKVIA